MYRYYTHMRFPKSAAEIPAIRDWLDEYGCDEEENGRIIAVSDPEANFGEIAITELLEERTIPFDHFHNDSNDYKRWTVYVRFNIDGTRVDVSESEFEIERSAWASDILCLLDAGDWEGIRDALESAVNNGVQQIETITDLSAEKKG